LKYITRTSLDDIRNKYTNIIGWGTGPLFFTNYRKDYFEIDFLIDGTGRMSGGHFKGIPIKKVESLKEVRGKSLIVIYTIYEKEIIEQLRDYEEKDIDLIIYSLLDINFGNKNRVTIINAKSCEDMLLLMLTRQLKLDTVQFLEIGVCHPIMRNNTYLLYQQFSHTKGYRGVLVEANPLCWELIGEYREKDILIQKGVGKAKDKIPFYAFPNLLGHSTFVKNLAEDNMLRGYKCETIEIETDTLGNIIKDNFCETPDILALDAEGLDYDILLNWDHKKYPFKIIISEMMENKTISIERLMNMKGYRIYARTMENIIWIQKEERIYI
jgi:FkbM family methyltransferase